jgi:hypothetical protein
MVSRATPITAATDQPGISSALRWVVVRLRCAIFGAKSRIAPEVFSRARNSSSWPSNTRTVVTAAASKHRDGTAHAAELRGTQPRHEGYDTLESQSGPAPSAMSVPMLRLRFFTDANARTKNGRPAHNTTDVASESGSSSTCVVRRNGGCQSHEHHLQHFEHRWCWQ